MKHLKLKCKPLDDLLGGGIESGAITEVYGEAGSGKSNLCLQAIRECASVGKKVAFVDSEGVSIERLNQICKKEYNFKKILDDIMFFMPDSFDSQEKMIKEVIDNNGVELIVV